MLAPSTDDRALSCRKTTSTGHIAFNNISNVPGGVVQVGFYRKIDRLVSLKTIVPWIRNVHLGKTL